MGIRKTKAEKVRICFDPACRFTNRFAHRLLPLHTIVLLVLHQDHRWEVVRVYLNILLELFPLHYNNAFVQSSFLIRFLLFLRFPLLHMDHLQVEVFAGRLLDFTLPLFLLSLELLDTLHSYPPLLAFLLLLRICWVGLVVFLCFLIRSLCLGLQEEGNKRFRSYLRLSLFIPCIIFFNDVQTKEKQILLYSFPCICHMYVYYYSLKAEDHNPLHMTVLIIILISMFEILLNNLLECKSLWNYFIWSVE